MEYCSNINAYLAYYSILRSLRSVKPAYNSNAIISIKNENKFKRFCEIIGLQFAFQASIALPKLKKIIKAKRVNIELL